MDYIWRRIKQRIIKKMTIGLCSEHECSEKGKGRKDYREIGGRMNGRRVGCQWRTNSLLNLEGFV